MAELDLRFHQPRTSFISLPTPFLMVLRKDHWLNGTQFGPPALPIYLQVLRQIVGFGIRNSITFHPYRFFSAKGSQQTNTLKEISMGVRQRSYTLPNHTVEIHAHVHGHRTKHWPTVCLGPTSFSLFRIPCILSVIYDWRAASRICLPVRKAKEKVLGRRCQSSIV